MANNASATVDFTFAKAGHVVNGSVRDSTVDHLYQVCGPGLMHTYDANNPDKFEVIMDAPVDGGEFTLNLPAGTYRIGLWISPESDYNMAVDSSTNLAEVEVALTGDESTSTADILVEKNNAVISGTFLDAVGEAVTNLDGEVFAVQGAIGRLYSLIRRMALLVSLTPGNWELDYYIEVADDASYLPFPTSSIQVTAVANSTVTQDITLSTLDGTITGTVVDPDGNAVTETVYVWVHRDTSQASAPRYLMRSRLLMGRFHSNCRVVISMT